MNPFFHQKKERSSLQLGTKLIAGKPKRLIFLPLLTNSLMDDVIGGTYLLLVHTKLDELL